jgi:ribosomal protein L29
MILNDDNVDELERTVSREELKTYNEKLSDALLELRFSCGMTPTKEQDNVIIEIKGTLPHYRYRKYFEHEVSINNILCGTFDCSMWESLSTEFVQMKLATFIAGYRGLDQEERTKAINRRIGDIEGYIESRKKDIKDIQYYIQEHEKDAARWGKLLL